MNKNNTFINTIGNNLFAMQKIFKFSKKRLIHLINLSIIKYVRWLFYSAVFISYIVKNEAKSIYDLASFIFISAFIAMLANLYEHYVNDVIFPNDTINIVEKINEELYHKVANIELECFENAEFYNSYTLVLQNAGNTLISTCSNFIAMIFGGIATVVSFIIMYNLDKDLMFFLVFPVLGNFIFGKKLKEFQYKLDTDKIVFDRKEQYISRVFFESRYAKELRLSNAYDMLMKIYQNVICSKMKILKKYVKQLVGYNFLQSFFTFAIIFEGVLLFGAYKCIVKKTMDLATMTVLTSVMVAATWILIGFSNAIIDNIKNAMYIERYKFFLQYKEKIPENEKGIMPPQRIIKVEFKNVSFGYGNNDFILKNINITIHEKQKIALVGLNGAGKTTLIKLLLRLYDPTEGEILVNDINIKQFDLQAYRSLFATALQDFNIFATTLYENITMGESISEEDILEALHKAGMDKTIVEKEIGQNTLMTKEFSDKGILLSGGLYQKVAIARVFAKNAAIKIFDEPTSALDPLAEDNMFKSIYTNSNRCITILISHRLSSIHYVDNIYVLFNGKICEHGSHSELMKNNGVYAEIYRKQAESYVNE